LRGPRLVPVHESAVLVNAEPVTVMVSAEVAEPAELVRVNVTESVRPTVCVP